MTLLPLLIAGLSFLGSHVLLSSTSLRGTLRDQLGERGFLLLYSAVAFATLAWFIHSYAQAPLVPLWAFQPWMVYFPVAVMPFASVLLVSGLTVPNPTAVGMERRIEVHDPAPGILRVTRHPVMWAIGLWALAHMVPNGDAASLIFFGMFAVLALGGTLLIDRKKRLSLGTHWARLVEVTSNVPFQALIAGRTSLRPGEIGLLRLVAGLLLYSVLLLAHPLYTGRPIPIY